MFTFYSKENSATKLSSIQTLLIRDSIWLCNHLTDSLLFTLSASAFFHHLYIPPNIILQLHFHKRVQFVYLHETSMSSGIYCFA